MDKKRHRIRPAETTQARRLRRDSTVPERLLWGVFRGRQLAGLKFRRQRAIGLYTVDFCCLDRSLVVEVDGESHVGRTAQDGVRTKHLEAQGLTVIRFTNDEVLSDLDAVVEAIARAAGVEL